MSNGVQTPGARLTALAALRPQEVALICEREAGDAVVLTRLELEHWANRLAHRLAELSVAPGRYVAIHLPNGVEHVVATLAAYKLGACPMPIAYRMPAAERDAMLALAGPAAVISDAPELGGISREQMAELQHYPLTPPADAVPQPFKAIASGGSTGKPKLIVSTGAFAFAPDAHPFARIVGLADGDRLYSPGPLYHNQAFLFTQIALFVGASALINERFDAERTLVAIERHRPTFVNMVPTMMQRMARSPQFATRDLGSIRTLLHMAAPCADWTKRAWIERIGAAAVTEIWAATELTGLTRIDGDEWLLRPGSVGRGHLTEISIRDADRKPLPANEVGEIFTRFAGKPPLYCYLGAAGLEHFEDGYTSVGDLGYVDDEGYLFLADRRTDLIISGGANIYPAEVESLLTQLDGVRDAVVIGLKDDDLGRRVHAIIEPADGVTTPGAEQLALHLRQHLAAYKVPRSFEVVPRLPRDEAGKLRRSSLRDERGG
jgi:bile acid-coenzyme A ligase